LWEGKGAITLEWIKVAIRHAEYDFLGASDALFCAWIRSMMLAATIEKLPTQEQLKHKLGAENYRALVRHFKSRKISLTYILKKVMEDVEVVKRQRKHNKEYMIRSRNSGVPRGEIQKPHVELRRNVYIREDKIREDKTSSLKDLSSKNPEIKASLEKMGVKL
jgi:hypothetical protein